MEDDFEIDNKTGCLIGISLLSPIWLTLLAYLIARWL
jgi:hypothetical protein